MEGAAASVFTDASVGVLESGLSTGLGMDGMDAASFGVVVDSAVAPTELSVHPSTATRIRFADVHPRKQHRTKPSVPQPQLDCSMRR